MIQLRLRHPNGDIGPFEVVESLTVAQVKDVTFSQWPTGEEGPGARPTHPQGQSLPRGTSPLPPLA
jgi:hypothetical protein